MVTKARTKKRPMVEIVLPPDETPAPDPMTIPAASWALAARRARDHRLPTTARALADLARVCGMVERMGGRFRDADTGRMVRRPHGA